MAAGRALPHTHLAREQPGLFTTIDTAWKSVCWYSSKVLCCDLLDLVEKLQLWIKDTSVKRQRVFSQGENPSPVSTLLYQCERLKTI